MKQINFVDVELGKEVNDEKITKHSAKASPDSKIDLVQAFFYGGINGAFANMVLFFLAIFLVGLICGFFAFIGSFFKVLFIVKHSLIVIEKITNQIPIVL